MIELEVAPKVVVTPEKRVMTYGTVCLKCHRGHYKATSLMGDIYGDYNCDKCGSGIIHNPTLSEYRRLKQQHKQ